jgi:hypothetical protein
MVRVRPRGPLAMVGPLLLRAAAAAVVVGVVVEEERQLEQ